MDEDDLDLDLDAGADLEEADDHEEQDDAVGEEAGHEDDEAREESSDEEGGRRQEEVGSRREPSRGERRVSSAVERARAAEEKAAAAQRRLDALEARFAQPTVNEEQQFEARIAQLPEWEQTAARAERREQLREREIRSLRMEMADDRDRTAFERLSIKNPAIEKVRDDVEKTLADIRSRGGNANREQIAYYVLGKQIAERAGRAGAKAQRRSGEARERQTSRPGAARSDAAPAGRDTNSAAARERRMENMEL